jgi:hypothetical protein
MTPDGSADCLERRSSARFLGMEAAIAAVEERRQDGRRSPRASASITVRPAAFAGSIIWGSR